MSITFHTITEHVPTVHIGQSPKVGRRAPELPAHIEQIAAEVPDVADALSALDAAIAPLREHADAMDNLSDEYEDYRAAYRATAVAGKVPAMKSDEFWQARADAIRNAHAAALPSAVDAQTALVALASPYVAAHVQADRDRIVKLADELAVLIGRSTPFASGSGIAVNYVKVGTVEHPRRHPPHWTDGMSSPGEYVSKAVLDDEVRRIIAGWDAEEAASRAPLPEALSPSPVEEPTSEPTPEPKPAAPSPVDTRALAASIRKGTTDSDARTDIRDIARQIKGY